MRFLALLKKELREALPWLLLAAIILGFFGAITIQAYSHSWREGRGYSEWLDRSSYRYDEPDRDDPYIDFYRIRGWAFLRDAAGCLLLISIGLGVILGARQFLMPLALKTWAFTIHRSIPRATILWAKFAATAITFAVSCGAIWTLLWWYASRPGVLPMPPRTRTLIEGWLFVVAGLVIYFGTVLSALSTVRWYTTRIVGLASATCILFFALSQTSLTLCIAMIAVGLVILVSQVVHTFLNREF